MFHESLTSFKSHGLIFLGFEGHIKLPMFFYFIFQNSNVLVISCFQRLISAEVHIIYNFMYHCA
jgi:hypothetical protein